jgi:hypothetical protein
MVSISVLDEDLDWVVARLRDVLKDLENNGLKDVDEVHEYLLVVIHERLLRIQEIKDSIYELVPHDLYEWAEMEEEVRDERSEDVDASIPHPDSIQ